METMVKSTPARLTTDGAGHADALGADQSAQQASETVRAGHPAVIPTKAYRIPNLACVCQVLRMFAYSDEKLSSSAVARRLKMPRTTVLRILHTLTAERLLQRQGYDFAAGGELLRLGLRAFGHTSVREMAVPVLRDLVQATGETAYLALVTGDKALVADVCDSSSSDRPVSRPGTLEDLHASAAGKVFLAFAPGSSATVGPLESHTRRTIVTQAELDAEIARARAQGYATDNEEQRDGVRSLAAPVLDSSGSLVAAIAVTGSTSSFPEQRMPQVAGHVVRAARALSELLGRRTEQASLGPAA